jgi:hypothetical protein
VITTRPLVLTTRTGFAIEALVDETVALVGVVVWLVRGVLAVASAGDPEMLAGGLMTEAAVGDSVRMLANEAGVETALLVGVIAVPEGAIVGAAAFVRFVPALTVGGVPAIVDAALAVGVKPSVPGTTPMLSRKSAEPSSPPTGSPAPLVITQVGFE